jgi:hypothetical protein
MPFSNIGRNFIKCPGSEKIIRCDGCVLMSAPVKKTGVKNYLMVGLCTVGGTEMGGKEGWDCEK